MGVKGDKNTNEAAQSVSSLLAKIESMGSITSKKMFGGFGIFHDGKMFGLVNSDGEVYLKANDSIRQKFEDAGAKSHGRMPYFSVPDDVIANVDQLINWVKESIDISK